MLQIQEQGLAGSLNAAELFRLSVVVPIANERTTGTGGTSKSRVARLGGVKQAISDAHEKLKAAAAKVLSANWRRCKVLFRSKLRAHADKGLRQMILAAIQAPLAWEWFVTAGNQWRLIADRLRVKFLRVAELLDGAEVDGVRTRVSVPRAVYRHVGAAKRIVAPCRRCVCG